jgi:hypothetical protein
VALGKWRDTVVPGAPNSRGIIGESSATRQSEKSAILGSTIVLGRKYFRGGKGGKD